CYQYDGLSRRILKQVRQNGEETTTWYGWDGDRQCAEATDARLRTTVHEPHSFVPLLRLEQRRQEEDPLLAEVRRLLASEGLQLPEEHRPAIEDLSVACFHTDHLGTPLRLTGEQGKTLWQGQADDWEAIDHEQGETDQPIRFQGQYRDEESGLYYNRYRYYAAELGRYVTQDPIGLEGGVNSYLYVQACPILSMDPLGLDTIALGGSIRLPDLFSMFFDNEAKPQGVSCGIAFSFPGFFDGEWDIGGFATVIAGGDGVGFGGRLTADGGYHKGSVSDLSGTGGELSGHFKRLGASISFDDNGDFSGATVHYGGGYNISGSGSLTGTIGARDGVRGYND
ncbi:MULTISPECIES: RHS repeat-associated core domain-containing protein, partial [unclassified Pseudomonas]|uniref:RHS repeat-associated core domain-containing protein n=1 Tax=unclassified Pseudomonas TaxID=196821 RepID=UPI00244A4E09